MIGRAWETERKRDGVARTMCQPEECEIGTKDCTKEPIFSHRRRVSGCTPNSLAALPMLTCTD